MRTCSEYAGSWGQPVCDHAQPVNHRSHRLQISIAGRARPEWPGSTQGFHWYNTAICINPSSNQSLEYSVRNRQFTPRWLSVKYRLHYGQFQPRHHMYHLTNDICRTPSPCQVLLWLRLHIRHLFMGPIHWYWGAQMEINSKSNSISNTNSIQFKIKFYIKYKFNTTQGSSWHSLSIIATGPIYS